MSVRVTIIRHKLIMNYLRNKPSSWSELDYFLKEESNHQGYPLSISQRQFQRDIIDILSIYGVIISNDRSKKHYFIENMNAETDRSLEMLDVLNLLRLGNNRSNEIEFERRRPSGSEHLSGIVHAIREGFTISFSYHKFYENFAEHRKIIPMVLKEAKNRWYILGQDLEKNAMRVFGLDRITDLEIGKKYPKNRESINTENLFKDCFGIILPSMDQKVEEIILSYTPFQARYIKSLPLHSSQEIIAETPHEVKVRLNMYVTYDFIMELLSVGGEVKVISPRSLKDQVKKELKRALEN